MKTFTLIAAAVAVAASAIPADAKTKHHHYHHYYYYSDSQAAPAYAPSRQPVYRGPETHDAVRAHAADPTNQYDLPDWARAAFAPRGHR